MKLRRFLPTVIQSTRARILGWMLLLVVLALFASVLAARSLLQARLDERLDRELAQEVGKFRTAAAEFHGRDVDALLSDYLRRKVPDHDETFFTVVDGRAARRLAHEPPARLDLDARLVSRMVRSDRPTYGVADSAAGQVRYAVAPVSLPTDPRAGALVIVEFRDRERRDVDAIVGILTLVGVGALLLAVAVGWVVAGRVLAPVRLVRRTAERITSHDMAERIPVKGDDDLARLVHTVNTMLDRLEQGFADQRRFLDDAGHELRTPLAVVRGHLELLGDDPADRAATMHLVFDEIDRMQGLVNDLLTLARAEQAAFLAPGPVDLAELPVEVMVKATALGDRRWTVDALAENTVVTADGHRLTQALVQLAANAVAHTGPGDVVAFGSEAGADGRARLWVRDSGPGVPDADRERIFERFARSEGLKKNSGTGLGLAIVRTIARAHGATVTVGDAPGGGAVFSILLPREEAQRGHP